MALVLMGKSRCPVCDRVFGQGEDIVAFPAIVSNENDPLYQIRDTAFHATCFTQHPLASDAQRRVDEWKARTSTGRSCYVCREEITHPDDYYILPHFSSDPGDPLFDYNYREFHHSCLKVWERLPALLANIDRLHKSGAWKGPVLVTILQAFEKTPVDRRI